MQSARRPYGAAARRGLAREVVGAMAQDERFSADLILVNGRVLTMDAADSVAEAVAIKDDKVLAVGTTREIEALKGSRTEAVDLKGRTALPGLADIHVH